MKSRSIVYRRSQFAKFFYLDHLLSYAAPLGGIHKRKSLQDNTYDGFVQKNPSAFLTDGLGKLTDGIIGSTLLIRTSDDSYSSPWVGYTKKVVILFTFRNTRRFYSLKLYVINRNKSIRLFDGLQVEISNDGTNFKLIQLFKPTKEQKTFKGPQAINVPLNGESGSFLRCSFTLNQVLMLLSEVQFVTVDALENDVTGLQTSIQPLAKTQDKTKLEKEERNNRKQESTILAGTGKNVNEKLSFPIILTIALVGTVFLVAVVVILVRFIKPIIGSGCKQPDVKSPRHESKPEESAELFQEKASLQNSVSRFQNV